MPLRSFHHGENILGNHFNDAHPLFEQTFMNPYNQFLEHVYCKQLFSTCSKRGIESTSTASSVCRSRSTKDNNKPDAQHQDSADEAMKVIDVESRDKEEMTKASESEVERNAATRNVTKATVSEWSREPDSASDASPSNASTGNTAFDGSVIFPQRSAVTSPSLDMPLSPNPLQINNLFYSANGDTGTKKDVLGSDSGSDGSAALASNGVDLDLFNSVMSGTGEELYWWMGDSFLNSLNDPNIDLSSSSLSSPCASLMQTGLGSYSVSVPNLPIFQVLGQSLQSESGPENGEPSQPEITNIDSSSSQLSHETPDAGSVQSPLPVNAPLDAPTSQPAVASADKEPTSERVVQTISKSGRSIIPSTRLEKMNEIGSNKENIAPAVVPSKSNNEWADGAKKYMLGLQLGEDWKVCVDAWVMIEASLEYGKGSKVR